MNMKSLVLSLLCLPIISIIFGQRNTDKIDSLSAIGNQLFEKSTYDSAKAFYEKAFTLAEIDDDSHKMAKLWRSLGNVAHQKRDYPEAMKLYFMHLKFMESHNDMDEYSKGLSSIGQIYYRQNDFDKAEEFFKKAIEIGIESNNSFEVAKAYQSYGTVFWKRGMKDSSLYYMRKSLKFFSTLDEPIRIARLKSNIGILYSELGNYDSAILSHSRALEVFEEREDRFSTGIASNNLANVYLKSGSPDKAKALISKGIFIGNQINDFHILEISYENLLTYYQLSNTNLEDTIFSVVEKLKAVKDSLFNEARIKQINELQTEYETKKKEQRIEALELEKRNERLERNAYAGGFFAVIVIGGFIAFGLWYRIRKNKQLRLKEKEIADEKLQNLQNELENYTLQLIERSVRIEELNRELEKAKSSISGDCPSYSGALDHLMQSTILTDDEWSQFKKLFSQVYPGFLAGIRQAHRDLTDTEERLLTLTKLNLTTREVASMLGISVESVNKSRYRLRKKLNVNSEELTELVASF